MEEGLRRLGTALTKDRGNGSTWGSTGFVVVLLVTTSFVMLRSCNLLLEACDHRPPGSLVGDLPEEAEVMRNESIGRDCERYVEVAASGASVDELEDALVAHFSAEGWRMTEGQRRWEGTRQEGSRSYSLSMTTERPGGGSFASNNLAGVPGVIHVEIAESFGEEVLPDSFPDPFAAVTGPYLGVPRFVGGLVVVPTGQEIVAFEPTSGAEVWRSASCPAADWASPVEGPESVAAIAWCEGDEYGHFGFEAATGATLWTLRGDGANVNRTRSAFDVLVLASDEAVSVRAVDATTGRVRWSTRSGDASIATDGERVFVANDQHVAAYDATSRDRLWAVDYVSSGLFADSRGVYARGNDQRLRRLDPRNGEVVWTSERISSESSWSDVVGVTDRTVVVQSFVDGRQITVIDINDGSILWTHQGSHSASHEAQLHVAAGEAWVIIIDLDEQSISAYDELTGEVVKELGVPGAAGASIADGRVAYVYVQGSVRKLGITALP